MFDSKSKRFGLFGTILFHIGLLVVIFFSSIGYTSIEVPRGLEIEFVPYDQEDIINDFNESVDNQKLNQSQKNNDNTIEKIIVEENSTVNIPHNEDTITLSEAVNPKKEISSELKNALSMINHNTLNDTAQAVQHNQNNNTEDPDNLIKLDYGQDGYSLSDNRDAIKKIKPKYLCEETGTVIVRVIVNRKGETIQAAVGIRGSTESASCLFKEAQEAALQTTWTPADSSSPERQVGYITYNFQNY